MKLALCAYHPNPDIFHAEKGGMKARMEALSVCMRCPVMIQCKEYSERIGSDTGIWGGELYTRETNKQKKNN